MLVKKTFRKHVGFDRSHILFIYVHIIFSLNLHIGALSIFTLY